MKDLAKLGAAVALAAGTFAGLASLAGGSVGQALGFQSTVGSCSTVGGQSSVGGQSTVGGQSNVCKIPSTPVVSNLPNHATFHGSFVAVVHTNGDGSKYVTTSTHAVCAVGRNGLTVTFVGVGTCTLTAHVAAGATYGPARGKPQPFAVGRATPEGPTIGNLPKNARVGTTFTARIVTNSPGTKSVSSLRPGICTVGSNKLTVTFVAAGTCRLVPHVGSTRDYVAATGSAETVTVG